MIKDDSEHYKELWDESLPHKLALVEALKSGKYAKGCSRLRSTDDTWCCYGVACELSGLGEFVSFDNEDFHEWVFMENDAPQQDYRSAAGLLPANVQRWLTGWAAPDRKPYADEQGRLFTIEGAPVTFFYDGQSYQFLYLLNDDVDTFDPVIKALEEHIAQPYNHNILVICEEETVHDSVIRG